MGTEKERERERLIAPMRARRRKREAIYFIFNINLFFREKAITAVSKLNMGKRRLVPFPPARFLMSQLRRRILTADIFPKASHEGMDFFH